MTLRYVVLGRSCALARVGEMRGSDLRVHTLMTSLGYVTLDLAWATYARNEPLRPPVLEPYRNLTANALCNSALHSDVIFGNKVSGRIFGSVYSYLRCTGLSL